MTEEQKRYNQMKQEQYQNRMQQENIYYQNQGMQSQAGMYGEYGTPYVSQEDSVQRKRMALSKSFIFMAIALCISAAAAWYTVASGLYETLFDQMTPFWILCGVEFALVIGTNACVKRQLTGLAIFLFLGYSIVNGVTLSSVLLIYSQESIASIFLIAAVMFIGLGVFGVVTKKDLSGVGQIGFMLLIGVIVLSIVNIFVPSTMLYNTISVLGLAVFIGLTAYDTQKIVRLAEQTQMSTTSIGIYGALELYLDFINLFLYLLRLFGSRD